MGGIIGVIFRVFFLLVFFFPLLSLPLSLAYEITPFLPLSRQHAKEKKRVDFMFFFLFFLGKRGCAFLLGGGKMCV